MEVTTTVSGILRRSPESRMEPRMESQFYDETFQASPTFQDKGSVRFVDDERMNSRLFGTPLQEKVHFNCERGEVDNVDEETNEDYSASVSAILQRKLSSRRSNRRRPSSPFSPEELSGPNSPRRRSSAFTTTSETAISIDDPNLKEEQIFENIRLHKEVIANVKLQPWPVRRKLKLIQQAKSYIKRHEGELQVRLKKSRSTRDIWTRFNIVLVKKWNHTKREVINFMNLLIPWELRIKEIESHFGTVVASYFTFLRWLFWVNLVTSIVLTAFVIVPEFLSNYKDPKDSRKGVLKEERTSLWDMLLNFDGIIIHSPIFYGWYSNCSHAGKYKVPTAYFMIGIGVYIYSFIATLRKMAANFRLSKLSEKEDECIFTWKLFTGWDYMIGNAETGHNRTSSIMLGFKEALLEEAEKKKEKRSWKIISMRVFVNLNVIWMLLFSAYAVIYSQSNNNQRGDTDSFFVNWWYQNETTVVMTVIGSLFPFIFEMFGLVEKYHPRKTLRIQLGRIMALNLLNLYSLTFAQFNQINEMTNQSLTIKKTVAWINETTTNKQPGPTAAQYINPIASVFFSDGLVDHKNRYEPLTVDQTASRNKRELYGDYQILNNTGASTQATSTIYEFLRSLEEFTDPATGKYDKPLPSTQSAIKNVSILRVTRSSQSATTWYPTTLSPAVLFTTTDTSSSVSEERTTKDPLVTPVANMTSIVKVPMAMLTSTSSELSNNFTPMFSSTEDLMTTEDQFTTDNFSESTTSDTEWWYGDNQTTDESANFTESMTSTFDEWRDSENLTTLYETEEPMTTEITKTTTVTIGTNESSPSTTTPPPLTFLPPTTPFNPEISLVHRGTLTQSSSMTTTTSTTTEQLITPFGTTVSTSGITPTASVFGTEGYEDLCKKKPNLEHKDKLRLRKLCWETMFGQELVKLTVMDLGASFLSTFFGDFIRALLVRYMNKVWCWDLEKKFPKYADFKIAENILHLVNNQGMVWMGMFFSPGLPLINVVKLMIMMYLRSWAVLTCNVPHEVVFRASRSNNFYLALLLTMLFLCVLPVCYAIVWLTPSWHCGPFSGYPHIYKIFATTLQYIVPEKFHNIMSYMASPGTIIPLIVVLLLIIYYLASLTAALREANIDLKIQLRRERTEERKKMFQMANRRKRGGSDMDSTFAKWKKVLQVPSIKMSDDSPYDFLEDPRRDDTDIDNGFLKHDEDDDTIRRLVSRLKPKPETPAEENWNVLLQLVPKSTPKINIKDSSSTTSSLKDDSSALSEIIPEIKISRVQTMENILKSDPTTSKSKQRKSSQSSEKEKTKDTKVKPSILEKWQQRRKETPKQSPEVQPPEQDLPIEQLPDADLNDVFLQSVYVDVPELANVPDSISNRIRRRLRKVISVGSSGEAATSTESERKSTEPTSSQSSVKKKEQKKLVDDLSRAVQPRPTLPEHNRPLLKSDSWHTAPGEKLPVRLHVRRRSSLSDLCELRTSHD